MALVGIQNDKALRTSVRVRGFMTFHREGFNNAVWFLAGLTFGALAGIFYAPRSGNETREAIKESLEDTRGYVKGRGRELQDRVSGWVDRGKSAVSRTKKAVSRTADEVGTSPASDPGREESIG
jgi:hypothetical protein